MKVLFLVSAAMLPLAGGADAPGETMRDKLRARVQAAGAVAPVPAPRKETPTNESESPTVVMSPFVVSEARRQADLTATLAREKHRLETEKFDVLSGGTLLKKEIGGKEVKLGGWYDPKQGWSFLQIKW